MKKKVSGLSMNAMLLMFALIPMIISIMVLVTFSISKLDNALVESTYSRLQACAAQIREYYEYDVADGSLTGTDDLDETDESYIDSLKSQGIELTLFMGDTRIETSVLKDDGSRNIGTTCDASIWSTVSAGNDYEADGVTISGSKYYVYYTPIYDGDGNVWGMGFAGEPQASIDSEKQSIMLTSLIIAAVLILIFITIALLFARKVAKPLGEVASALDDTARGDLNANTDIKTNIAETKMLVGSARTLQTQLQDIIGKTKNISVDLKSGADTVAHLSATSTDGANQISSAMEDLAQGATSMAENVQSINEQVIDMGMNIDSISDNAEDLAKLSNDIKAANKDASDYIEMVSKSSVKSVGAVQEISEQISETNASVNNIKEAVEMISSIASQTNLLALNASIEAARAGEAGKGFAVVATEIKSLSEQSNSSAEQIKTIVNEIVTKSEKSVALSADVAEIISEEQKYIEDTQNKFNLLNQEIAESLVQIESISSKVGALNNAKVSITGAVQDLSAISEENAASNQQVSASVSGIVDAIADIATNSETTNTYAVDLTETVGYFK